MADSLSYSLRSTFAKEFFQSLTDPLSNDDYYMFYGRAKPWDGNTAPTIVDTIKEQNEAKRNTIFYQKIIPSDVSLVAPRYDWTSGIVYDQYEDDVELWKLSKKYYVLVQEGDEFGVFICLSNNGGSPSTSSPSLPNNGSAATQETITADGYVWKYLYTLTDEMEKFLTSNYIPVVVLDKISYNDVRALALAVKTDAENGSIQKITINTTAEFSNLVNADLTNTLYSVTTYNSGTLTMTASIGAEMSSVNGFYDTNYVVFFENGKIATIDSYTVNNGVATIILCEVYPDNGTPIQTGDVFSILPKVNVKGNGSGAVLVPVFTNNTLTNIVVMNGGSDYNFAEVFFLVNTTASLSVVIPPNGGHGYDILGEIKPTNILISKDVSFASIPDDQEKYFGNSSFLRQIGIVKNIQTASGTNPNNQTNEYNMVLKYGSDNIIGTQYGIEPDDYTFPYWATAFISRIESSPTLSNNPQGQQVDPNLFYTIGTRYQGTPTAKQTVTNPVFKLVNKKIVGGKLVLYFEAQSNCLALDMSEYVTNLDTQQQARHTVLQDVFTKNILRNNQDVYYHCSDFRNSDGKVYVTNVFQKMSVNSELPPTQYTNFSLPNAVNPAQNFFQVGDVISFHLDFNQAGIVFGIVQEVYNPGLFGFENGFNSTIPVLQNNMSTTIKLSSVSGNLFSKSSLDLSVNDFVNIYCGHIKNLSKLDEVFDADTGESLGFTVPRSLTMDSGFGMAQKSHFVVKDKTQLVSNQFDASNYLFSNPESAPATAPTHILGNDTLSTAKIESFSIDPVDPSKLNLKITSPSDDFEPATITQNEVTSGESVTLFRRTTNGFTNNFSLVEGNTQNLYVLSENYDVSSPNNIPDTILGSVVSKFVLSKNGVFGSQITPIESYLYREATETQDSASGFILSQDVEQGSTTKTKNIYVQMEKGTFTAGDTLICVANPFVKNVTLYNSQCAGNTGVSAVTVTGAEERYNNVFLNKYSGEVLYIQNINPVQLSTDTNFTTNILLGF